MWVHCCLRQLLPVSLICDLGGLPQWHPIKIILEVPSVFFQDHYILRSQPVDKHEGPLFSANIQRSRTIPSKEPLSRPLGSQLCMLHMLDLAQASDRAFKMVSIMFCVGRLILLAQIHTNHTVWWLEGKLRVIIIKLFNINNTVLSRNILADYCMRWHQEWGAMTAVGWRRSPWLVGAWFTCFYLRTLCVMCSPSKKSCQCGVQDFAFVGSVKTWYKNFRILHCSQRNPFQKQTRLALSSWKRHFSQKCY